MQNQPRQCWARRQPPLERAARAPGQRACSPARFAEERRQKNTRAAIECVRSAPAQPPGELLCCRRRRPPASRTDITLRVHCSQLSRDLLN
eukprot:4331498-Pyramimonas_sp.AAC.1